MSKTARLLTALSFSFFLSTGAALAADKVCKDRCTAQMKACSKALNLKADMYYRNTGKPAPADMSCLSQLQACMSKCQGLN